MPSFPSRLHILAAAVWGWWLLVGAHDVPAWGKGAALLAALALPALFAARSARSALPAAGAAGRDARRLPFWPSRRVEGLVLASSALLVLNAFCWRRFGLTPRLSFLTAGPLIWTAALAAETAAGRLPFAPPARRLQAMGRILERHRLAVAAACLLAFNLWFTAGAWLRLRSMQVEFWDVGSISQAMSNLAHGFGYVKSVPEGLLSNRFAQHVEPVFLLLSPLLRTDRGVEILCLLQTLCVSLAALFTGLAMERILRHPAAFWIGCLGLCLHPAAGFPLWSDFHGDVFALLPLSILLWAHAADRNRTFWAAFLAAAACKEYSLLATGGIALMMLWAGRRQGATRRRGALLLAASGCLFLAVELWFMPLFRPEGMPSVLSIHMGPYRHHGTPVTEMFLPGPGRLLAGVFSVANLSNLFQALLPFSAFLLAGPAALLGASANIAKDMAFGFDIGTHHFTPALPILFAGMAWVLRERVTEARRAGALLQMGICLLLSGLLWGSGFWSPLGRHHAAAWLEAAPAAGKAHRLHAEADPRRPKLVTGALGGVLFRAPALYFLGTPGARLVTGSPAPELDVYLELWDQPFPSWAPLDRARDDIARFLSAGPGGAWTVPYAGVLKWTGPEGLRGLDKADFAADAMREPGAAEDPGAVGGSGVLGGLGGFGDAGNLSATSEAARPADRGRVRALVLLDSGGRPIPLGLKTPGHPWLLFDVRLAPGWRRGAALRLLSAPYARENLAAVKTWDVAGEWALEGAGAASRRSRADGPAAARRPAASAIGIPRSR